MDPLLTPADAARILGVVPATVRLMAQNGRLPALRTQSGMRLFRRKDVERLAAVRAANSRRPPAANNGKDSSSSTAPARPATD